MFILSHATNNDCDSDSSHAKLNSSPIEDGAIASILSDKGANKSTPRFIYTSLSSSSSSECSDSKSSSESDISDSYFSHQYADVEFLSASIKQKCRSSNSDLSHGKLKPSTVEDTATASILSDEGANFLNESTRRFLYTSFFSSSSSERSESEHSNSSHESDVSKCCNQSAGAEASTLGGSAMVTQKCRPDDAELLPRSIESIETSLIISDRDPLSSFESVCRFWSTVLPSSSSSTSRSESDSLDSDFYCQTLNDLRKEFDKTYNPDMASEKFTYTHNWVQSFDSEDTSNDEDIRVCGNATKRKQVDLDTDLEDFVCGSRQRYKKYWKTKKVHPDSKLSAPKGETHSERIRKVTFAPDDVLVTVRTFEREPEELLPDTFALDRIRFQMRINSFSALMVPFLTMEHRVRIMQRNGLNPFQ